MKTKSALKLSFVVAAIAVVSGCSTSSMNSVGRATQGVAQAAQSSFAGIGAAEPQTVKSVRCDEAVKTISLAPLQCKASSCQEQNSNAGNFGALINYAREQEGLPNLVGFGDGMTDMLTSALSATGCFNVVDRELMAELAKERALAGLQAPLEAADAMATGSITSLSYDKSSTVIGGGFVPVIGGIKTSKVTASIGMDVRVIDVKTGRITYTQTYQAESGKRGYGMAGGGLIGGGLLGGGHSVKGGVEMEEAAREIIQNIAFDMVVKTVPASQYRIEEIPALATN